MTSIDPRDAEILTAYVLGRDRTWLRAHPEAHLTRPQDQRLRRLLARRQTGVPVAYLTGKKEFFGRDFFVGRGVLVPRPESEQLIDEALRRLPARTPTFIADIGTGSGCLAITLATERPKATIVAVDRSATALRYARRNARKNRVQSRVRIRRSNLLTGLSTSECDRLDLVIANLPYLKPNEIQAVPYEPRLALVAGRDGMSAFREFFQHIHRRKIDASILLEIDPRRANDVVRLAKQALPEHKISTLKDLSGRNRIVTIDRA